MKRLFIGIRSSLESVQALTQSQTKLKTKDCMKEARWLDPASFHLTLHFLADVDEERETRLRSELRMLKLPPAFRESLDRWIFFPQPSKASVVGLGAYPASVPFLNLWRMTADVLNGLKLPVETAREIFPHVTLGRFRKPVNLEFEIPSAEPVTVHIPQLTLFQSLLGGHGSKYDMIEEFTLAQGGGS